MFLIFASMSVVRLTPEVGTEDSCTALRLLLRMMKAAIAPDTANPATAHETATVATLALEVEASSAALGLDEDTGVGEFEAESVEGLAALGLDEGKVVGDFETASVEGLALSVGSVEGLGLVGPDSDVGLGEGFGIERPAVGLGEGFGVERLAVGFGEGFGAERLAVGLGEGFGPGA